MAISSSLSAREFFKSFISPSNIYPGEISKKGYYLEGFAQQSLQSIKNDADNPVNQSNFKARTSNWRKRVQVSWFYFWSGEKVTRIFKPIAWRSNEKPKQIRSTFNWKQP